MKRAFHAFLLGFVPTCCLLGLLAGLSVVWVNTQSVLTPAAEPIVIENSRPQEIQIAAFGEKTAISLPKIPDKLDFFSSYPALFPRSLRLVAWGVNELEATYKEKF